MAKHRPIRFQEGFGVPDLSRVAAEQDSNLNLYYVGEDRYVNRAIDRCDPASIFVGPKGIGKSAILQMVRRHASTTGNASRTIELNPDDLAFTIALKKIVGADSTVDPRFLLRTIWTYMICVSLLEIEKDTENTLTKLLHSVAGGKYKQQQEKLLRLTTESDGSSMSITDRLFSMLDELTIQGGIGGAGAAMSASFTSRDTTSEPNSGESLGLLHLIQSVSKALPSRLSNEYYVIIDDLDLLWDNSDAQNAFIGALLEAIRTFAKSEKIKFVVSLRKDIYDRILISERDKFRDYVVSVRWHDIDIKNMVSVRLSTILLGQSQDIWCKLFPDGSFEYLWDQTTHTPREMIELAGTCVKAAYEREEDAISAASINSGVREFSRERLLDLTSDQSRVYPGLEHVVNKFRGGKKEFSIDDVWEVGCRITKEFNGSQPGNNMAWAFAGSEDPVSLARSLLTCGFLLLKHGRSDAPFRPSSDQIVSVSTQNYFAIHPMCHAGLGLSGHREFSVK